VVGCPHSLDRLLCEPVREPEAEFGVELPGLDVVVGGRLDPGGDPDQHVLGTVEQPIGQLDLVEGVDDQVADAGLERIAELCLGLVVAVQMDAGWVEAGGQRHMELSARGDIHRQTLLAHHPVGGGGGERLARVDHLERIGALIERAHVLAGTAAHVVLGIDVGGCPEPLGQLDDVTASDLQVAALVHARARRVDRRGGDRVGGRHRPRIVRG
jgi:hypothetical protein